jgi:hypothetical protein
MVYKRYIKKKGKIYGPYLYKSIRDSDGKVKNIYVKKAKPAASKRMKFTLHKLPRNLFLLPLVIIIAASGTMFFLQPTGLIVMEETQSAKSHRPLRPAAINLRLRFHPGQRPCQDIRPQERNKAPDLREAITTSP